MDKELISIKKPTALVILKHNLSSRCAATISRNLQQLPDLDNHYDKIFCEYLSENQSPFLKEINLIQYLPIKSTHRTRPLNQKNAILNLLRHYFSDYDKLLIIPEEVELQGVSHLKKLEKELNRQKKTNIEGIIGLKPKEAASREFDFFMENTRLIPTIKQCSFINDEGLLELFENHEYFQPPLMPKQGASK